MDWDNLNNEHKIRTDQVFERADRQNTLSLFSNKSKQDIKSAFSRVNCWVCMDKRLVWGNRGWGANIDGKGTHDLLLCGRCQPNTNGRHKWNQCRDWSYIEGSRFLPKDDYASDDKTAAQRLLIVCDKA